MKQNGSDMSAKKPYVKPTVTEIKLASDEAVLAGCKGAQGHPGPFGGAKCGFFNVPCSQTSPS